MEANVVWKRISLGVFYLHNSAHPIVLRLATTESSSRERASTSVILLLTEFFKLVFSFGLLALEEGSVALAAGIVYEDFFMRPRESLHLAVPAVIYPMQNALIQWSAGHLPAAVLQVSYQGKILVTAMFSVVLLQKEIKRVQWLAMLLMGMGVAIIQSSDAKETHSVSMANAHEQDIVVGLTQLGLASCCSGFASVYTEKVFKQIGANHQKHFSVWLQNISLSVFSMQVLLLSYVIELMFPSDEGRLVETSRSSVLRGFTALTWVFVVNNAVGGLVVAMVIKHADSILRNFASALATLNCTVLSVFFFGFVLRASFGLGTILVLGSALLYGGVLTLPGEWWNSELRLFSARPTSAAGGSALLTSATPKALETAMDFAPLELELESLDATGTLSPCLPIAFTPAASRQSSPNGAATMDVNLVVSMLSATEGKVRSRFSADGCSVSPSVQPDVHDSGDAESEASDR